MNRRARIVRWTALAGLVVVIGTLGALAGPLDPPAGPVSPTGKTLAEVEPRIAVNAANTPGDADSIFRITQPGSYYLTGNINGVSGKRGVEIVASGVTLDLNGFDLLGVPGSLEGVLLTLATARGVCVVNGSVRAWGGAGVNLDSFGSLNCRVANLLVSANGGDGIIVPHNGMATECAAYDNRNGIVGRQGCVISRSSAYENRLDGIVAAESSTVHSCTATFNGGNGITVSSGSIVTACTSLGNTADGIRCGFGARIEGNTCRQNGNTTGDGAGIHATGADNRIEGNNCCTADRGIDVGAAGNIIIRNTCSANTTDWEIAVNNVIGPILDRRAPASAAVSGFSAPSSLGSADANANFSY